ncbi:acyl-CoA dehydrogenase family protein [Streptosporangium sp. NBC_01755]|uniref:acyl-CoA dehydrogenase family protein n=1 Tax=unclassified Streptosporangium TaxID=2632669 RepID=UPI002DD9A9D6|nr:MULTISPECIES: acyl-CoA dehydrogenase family protein [unclassified Streptosporangium]WSA26756.1 acyl-CoA dehydrogenase family protein [Streptosporangium sp. NBC_01810]WSD01819.1 acyl-CoA dehydrogenase family protein [Streptosporangium sp. NBC_01755]
MSIVLNTEERDLQQALRRYLDTKIAPLVAEYEKRREFPWDLLGELYEFGYVRGAVAREHGGDQVSAMVQAILMEEAGRCWGSLRTTVNVQGMVAMLLSRVGTAAQRARFLDPMLAASRFGWFALTEAEAGSDAGALRSTGRREGDSFVLNGRKIYITNALHSEFGILLARQLDEDGTDRGVSAFLVDAAESPYDVHDIAHMPVRSTTSCELVFDDVRIPAENLLGEPGSGFGLAMAAVNQGRLNMAMGAVGLSQACLEAAVKFSRERSQFGKSLAEFQLVQQMVVDIAVGTQTARLLGYDAARVLDAGGDGRFECSMAKYYCGETAGRSATLALQVHGGAGLMEEFPVERYFRDAREATIPEGTSQIQVLQMGKHLLGRSALR